MRASIQPNTAGAKITATANPHNPDLVAVEVLEADGSSSSLVMCADAWQPVVDALAELGVTAANTAAVPF